MIYEMNAVQVIPSVSAESSGPSYYMARMKQVLEGSGVNVELCTLDNFPSRWNRLCHLGVSSAMYRRLRHVAAYVDIIHNNSLWMMPNVYPYWAAKGKKVKVVTSPHGTMSKWALKHGWLKKKIFGCIQYPALKRTDMFHATCEKEYDEIRALGYKQPIAIIPIGVTVPDVVKPDEHERGGLRKLAFFGRLHKVKAVDNLIKAWGLVADKFKDWELVIAGPDCGFRSTLDAIIVEGKIPRVRFAGEINGQGKYNFLADADLCVLPSHTENFGVTVAEALACGTPVVASQGTPWKGLVENGCGWWIPIGVEPLARQLQETLAMDRAALLAKGERGREWMKRDFDWKAIGRKMRIAYEWLTDPINNEKPSFIETK